jgi:hypothetical protein
MIALLSQIDAAGLIVGLIVALIAAALAGMLTWWFGRKDT